jgi:hypothetical protein
MSCHTLQILILVALTAAACSAQNRSTFVVLEHSPSSLAYDPVRKRLYVAQPSVNQVDIVEMPSGKVSGSISIPRASTVALSPTSDMLLVGTIDWIYAVDPATRQVVNRGALPLTTFGRPSAISRMAVTKSGKVLFGGAILQVWDPRSGYFSSIPGTVLSQGDQSVGLGTTISASYDGSKVIIVSGFGRTHLYDSDTETVKILGSMFGPSFLDVAANHDGSQFAAFETNQLHLYDASFTEIFRMTISSAGFLYSRDGRYLYIATYNGYGRIVLTLDTSTFQVVAQAPGVVLLGAFFNQTGNSFYNAEFYSSQPMAVGEDGILFGAGSFGVAIEDTTNVAGLDSPVPYIGRIFPAQGPTSGGTALTLRGFSFSAPPLSVHFGTPAAATVASLQSSEILTAASPPSEQSGPVNVKANFASGWFALSPNGFTYGPHILYLLTSGGPSTGGTTVKIIGYGFDFSPALIQVTVGGQPATIVNVSRDAPNTLSPNGFSNQFGQHPYHLIEVITPSGIPGEADVTISTPAGSTTATRAFVYLKTSTVIPYAGELATPTYDWLRGRVYFSDPPAGKVVALDIATRQFLPMFFSAGAGPGRSSLTPDGGKLVVANQGERSISIFNPDNPQDSTKVEVIQNGPSSDFIIYGLATTALNKVFVVPLDRRFNVACSMPVLKVDLGTLQVTQNAFPSCLHEAPHLSSSRDGTKVFMVGRNSTGGPVKAWNAETDSFIERYLPSIFEGFRNDVAASADGNMFVGELDVIDSELRLRSRLHPPSSFFYIDPFTFRRGMRLNASGSLAYVPREHGYVDQHNARTGKLLRRIKMPAEFYLSPTLGGYDDPPLMTVDDSGRTIYGVAETGAMVIELADVPLALGSISPAVDVPEGGAVARIRGSGFRPDSIVSFGAQDLVTTFIDENTLQVTTPAHPVGRVSVSTRNPNGDSATMYAEFRYTPPAAVPSIISVTPSQITLPAASFVLRGLNFIPESQVLWNSIPLPTEVKDSTELSAYHNQLVAVTTGTSQLTVKNPPPGGGTSSVAVQVFNPAAGVTFIYPDSLRAGSPSFSLRFNPTNLLPQTKLYFNDVEIPYGTIGGFNAWVDQSLIAAPGEYVVRAENPPPVLGSGASMIFRVLPASPDIGFEPGSPPWNTLVYGVKRMELRAKNYGTLAFQITQASATPPYHVVSASCSNAIEPGQTCIFTLEFRPTTVGTHNGTFNLTGNAFVYPQPLVGSAIDLVLSLQRPPRSPRSSGSSANAREYLIPFTLSLGIPYEGSIEIRCTSLSLTGTCAPVSPKSQPKGHDGVSQGGIRWLPSPRAGRLRSTNRAIFAMTVTGEFGSRTFKVDIDPRAFSLQ